MSYMRTKRYHSAMGDICNPQDSDYDPNACLAGGVSPGMSSGSSATGPVIGAPPTSWTNVGGICYPNDSNTSGTFKELQRQLNRIAFVIKAPLIGVDGDIGPFTMSLIGTIDGSTKTSGKMSALGLSSASCDTTAAAAMGGAVTGVQAVGDGLGAPSSVASPSGSPQIYNASTGTLQSQGAAASIADIWGNLSSTEQIGVAIGAGVLAYMAFGRKKTKPTTKALSRRY